MVSLHFAGNSQWSALFWDNHPPLYLLILKLTMFLFGSSEFVTRLLSVGFSFVTLLVVFSFLRKQTNRFWAVTASLLFILSPAQILMAREARNYALFELLLTINLVTFWPVLRQPKSSKWAWISSSLALLGTHYFSLFVLSFEVFILLTWTKPIWQKMLVGATLFILSLAACYSFIDWHYLVWQNQNWQRDFAGKDFLIVILSFGAWGTLIFIPLLNILLQRQYFLRDSWNFFLNLLPVLGLMAALSAAGIFAKNIFFIRYFEFLLVPMLFVFAETGFHFFKSSEGRKKVILSGVLLFGSLVSCPWAYFPLKAPWRQTVEFLKNENPGSSPVIWTSGSLALETPYFRDSKFKLRKLEGLQPLLEVKSKQYIVESYFSGLAGLTYAQDFFRKQNRKAEIREIRDHQSDILWLLEIGPVESKETLPDKSAQEPQMQK